MNKIVFLCLFLLGCVPLSETRVDGIAIYTTSYVRAIDANDTAKNMNIENTPEWKIINSKMTENILELRRVLSFGNEKKINSSIVKLCLGFNLIKNTRLLAISSISTIESNSDHLLDGFTADENYNKTMKELLVAKITLSKAIIKEDEINFRKAVENYVRLCNLIGKLAANLIIEQEKTRHPTFNGMIGH